MRLPLGASGCYASGAALGTKGQAVTLARATTATYLDSANALQTCSAGSLRVGSWGAIIEPARTNTLERSAAIDPATYPAIWLLTTSGTAPVVTASTTDLLAPDLTQTASKVAFPQTDATKWAFVYQQFTGTAAAWSGAIWLRTASGTATVYLLLTTATPSAGQWVACSVSTTWTRCTLPNRTLTAATWRFELGFDARTAGGNPTGTTAPVTVYAWNGQAELGPASSSDIISDASAASRSADAPSDGSDISVAYGAKWCRGGTWTPVGAWTNVGTLWSAGSGANSASLAASGSDLVFTVTDAASGTKTVTYALASLAAGARRVLACTNSGALGLYVDAVSVGAVAGAGTGVIATAPTLSLGTNAAAALLDWRSCMRGTPGGDCR